MAFYEAVRTYNAAGGSFGSYARLVIDRRLTDHYRAARRFDAEVPLSPQIFDGAVEAEQPDAEVQRAVVEKMAAPAAAGAADSFTTRLRNIFRECVTEINAAQNMVVIKTLPGLGQAAAMAIDAMRASDVIGTLGGDDTVFVVMRDNDSADRFCRQAHDILK